MLTTPFKRGPFNRPREFSERRLRELVAPHGQVTQVKLMPKRRFAYIGYAEDAQAEAAAQYLNNTFVDTSKIEARAGVG